MGPLPLALSTSIAPPCGTCPVPRRHGDVLLRNTLIQISGLGEISTTPGGAITDICNRIEEAA